MESGICLHSIIPVRSEPSHKSEMVTQVLFGELYEVIEKESQWYKVKLNYDDYEGWISILQVNLLNDQEYRRLENSDKFITMELVQLLSDETGKSMIPIVIGSSLPGLDESRIRVGQKVYFYDGLVSGPFVRKAHSVHHKNLNSSQQIIEDAMLYLNAPYQWGGLTPFGIDCSGFVQMIYKLHGLNLQRDASQQASQGEVVNLLEEAGPGDLAFFDDTEGNIIHVGMLIDNQRIIHCSGQVQINTVDHEGIYSTKLQRYTHKLRLIRRII